MGRRLTMPSPRAALVILVLVIGATASALVVGGEHRDEAGDSNGNCLETIPGKYFCRWVENTNGTGGQEYSYHSLNPLLVRTFDYIAYGVDTSPWYTPLRTVTGQWTGAIGPQNLN